MGCASLLYIEDNPADVALFSGLIQQAGGGSMQIVSSPRLQDACHLLDAREFSAVVVDLNLDDTSGTHGVALLKQHYPDIPLIVLTGMDDDQLAYSTVQLGAQDYIVKGSQDGHSLRRRIQHSILRQHHANQLFFTANYDEATGLPKYQLFMELVQHAVARAMRAGEPCTLMLVDLEGFQAFGRTEAPDGSDPVMAELAKRLTACLRDSDIAARYGTEAFAVLLEPPGCSAQDCLAIAQKIHHQVAQPLTFGQQQACFSVCMGIALFPDAGNDAVRLVASARHALGRARKKGMGSVEFQGLATQHYPATMHSQPKEV